MNYRSSINEIINKYVAETISFSDMNDNVLNQVKKSLKELKVKDFENLYNDFEDVDFIVDNIDYDENLDESELLIQNIYKSISLNINEMNNLKNNYINDDFIIDIVQVNKEIISQNLNSEKLYNEKNFDKIASVVKEILSEKYNANKLSISDLYSLTDGNLNPEIFNWFIEILRYN